MSKISIIIPVHKEEIAHYQLVEFLKSLDDPDIEVIVSSGFNRANAMNEGAKKAKHKFLWFVHADTTFEKNHIKFLKEACFNRPQDIHYFDLCFAKDGPIMRVLNAKGANIRSRFFNIPWGDQAFCCSQDIFKELGRYNENVVYGEDHLFIWAAHHHGIKLNPLKLTIKTSAREYSKKGWLLLTSKRQYLWLKQAMPQLWILIQIKLRKP